ncbi:proline-rich transmembrane protein 1-like [Dunckerocampus dactyliophorus]|uniref:proline-rich transmembrane protein 1-like n=1 Tax=Dunckerocampus dactyliophorus TaxID=161453 RepID=UPI002405369B|nr:proline-rich transmembrane protein 1-like [Dunckerocampus dactyliophorus]XP_054638328.1 proline-rich transmembrane protein 1-like [Dunckerocampus dactyliophorus]
MDPSAPPKDWTKEKSSMGQVAPPPYQDNPYPGYPQPGPGYPQPAPGYPQPGSAYPHSQDTPYPPPYGGAVYGHQQYTPGHQYPPQPATVTVQPTVFVTQGPLANPVNDYLCYSIFNMLCCCLPLGIAALIYSINAREANHSGDQLAAERNSRTARTLNHVGLGLGIGAIILMIVYLVVVVSLVH